MLIYPLITLIRELHLEEKFRKTLRSIHGHTLANR